VDDRTNMKFVQALAVASQLALLMGACVLVGLVGGYFLDRSLGTSPLFLMVGSILGMVAGIYSVAKTTRFVLGVINKSDSSQSNSNQGRESEEG
jgi:F0F1-type ATP synthase assembly protein I